MSETKIKNEDFNQRPILLDVKTAYKIYFQSLHFLKTLKQFCHYEKTKKSCNIPTKGQIYNKYNETDTINREI